MKFQQRSYWCGPAAVENAMQAVGLRSPGQIYLAKVMGTTEDGTDEHGILRGFRSRPTTWPITSVGEYTYAGPHAAWDDLRTWLATNGPMILCVDSWLHWVTAVGVCGRRVVILDPERTRKNLARGGVMIQSKRALIRRWCTPIRETEGEKSFYAIGVSR